MRVYISGPITGVDNYKETFDAAAKELRAKGYTVCNPAHFDECLPDGTHSEYMRLCMDLLRMCDAIYMLPGYRNSKGARMEHAAAVSAGLDVMWPNWEEAE